METTDIQANFQNSILRSQNEKSKIRQVNHASTYLKDILDSVFKSEKKRNFNSMLHGDLDVLEHLFQQECVCIYRCVFFLSLLAKYYFFSYVAMVVLKTCYKRIQRKNSKTDHLFFRSHHGQSIRTTVI